VLKDLLSSESGVYERRELIAALAHRSEAAAVEPLSAVIKGDQPGVLQFSAVQGLSGRAEALPLLTSVVETGLDRQVRLEALRGIGLIRNETAQATLTAWAQQSSMESFVRQAAIQELRRTYGLRAEQVLQTLTSDPQPEIRSTAAQALAMLQR